jgi:hypothetical protein
MHVEPETKAFGVAIPKLTDIMPNEPIEKQDLSAEDLDFIFGGQCITSGITTICKEDIKIG